MDALTPNPTCRATDFYPDHIRATYRQMALVTSEEQLERVGLDDDTLIVSCDWLLWQKAIANKQHCVHYEQGITLWAEPDTLDSDLMIKSNSWLYDNGEDPTLFHGVSLGKLFHGQVLFCHLNIYRLERSLLKLIEKFMPAAIHFYDFANDINVLNKDMRRLLVQSVASSKTLKFTDHSQDNDPSAHSIAEDLLAAPSRPSTSRKLTGQAYGFIMSTLTRFRSSLKRKPKVLLLLGGNTLAPLLEKFDGGNYTPVVQARTVPKKIGRLLSYIHKGVQLIDMPDATLTASAQAQLKDIRSKLDALLVDQEDPHRHILYRFLRTYFLNSTRLEDLAGEVMKAEKVMGRIQPQRILVDGVRNPPPRIYIELAQYHDCDIDYLWHSPMVPQYLKFDALGGDPNTKPMVSRCLSWGPMNEHWLDSVGAKMPRVRVGSPLSDRYSGWKSAHVKSIIKPASETNVLVLQYAPILSDLKSLNASLYFCFVEFVRRLKDEGFENVRFKLHPGPGRWKKAYFKAIADFFNLDVEILKTEPYGDCVDWADIIVGPAQTGAFFETLAAGKPYYAYILKPNSYDVRCYTDYPVSASIDDVVKSVRNREMEGDGAPDGAGILDQLYSMSEFPSGSQRLWQVIAESITGKKP